GRFEEAMVRYQEQALSAARAEVALEARCKAGLCLVQLERTEEAAKLFEQVAAAKGERWPIVAGSQLWLIRLQQKRWEESGALFDTLTSRIDSQGLVAYIPEALRQRVLKEATIPTSDFVLPDPSRVQRLEQVAALADLFQIGSSR